MFIGHKMISEVLNQYDTRTSRADNTHCLTAFLPLSAAIRPYTKHILYMVKSPEELKGIEPVPYINFLIFNPDRTEMDGYLDPDIPVNYTEIYTDDIYNVTLILRDFFNEALGSALLGGTVLDMLFDDRSIQDMVDSFTKAFDNPIFVFDAGFHLIAANYEMAKDQSVAERIIRNGGLTDEDFKLLNDPEMPYSVIRERERPVRLFRKTLGFEQMICAIDTKKDMGHIVLSAINRPFNSADEKMLMTLKEGIHQQMIKQDFIRNNAGFPYEFFLKDLLDGKIAAKSSSSGRMDYVNAGFSGNICCMVIETARTKKTLNIYRIRSDFESLIPGTKSLLYNGEIIVLYEFREGKEFPDEMLSKIGDMCKEGGLYAGMSNHFSDITGLSSYYKQALRAIELGASESDAPGLYRYCRYYMQHIINIFSQKSEVSAFCYPKLQVLLDYDKENGTELAYSLYMYLICERNSIAASEAMFIHRNTLLYRLKKIDSVVDIDYDNYDERRYLIISYEMIMNTRIT